MSAGASASMLVNVASCSAVCCFSLWEAVDWVRVGAVFARQSNSDVLFTELTVFT